MPMKWFGDSWGAPVNRECARVPTPVGALCGLCEKPLAATDAGVVVDFFGPAGSPPDLPYHYECWIRSVLPPAYWSS